ncbi:MAG: DUF1643 domain-containing protein [Anaerolineae bacterium]|nr:DUF1643 domain-containing protein [Anaerolineae bacterium]
METSATISPCEQYRYELRRVWDDGGALVLFVCLNPSVADGELDDHTSRVCIQYARRWGYGGLLMGNLFAYRSTDPVALYQVADPVGPENDDWLKQLQDQAALVVCAWGARGAYQNRDEAVLAFLQSPHCLVKLKNGRPGHPLYKSAALKPGPL